MHGKENTTRPLKNAGLSQRARPRHLDAYGRWNTIKQHLDASVTGDTVKQVLHKGHSAAVQNHVYRTDVILNHQPQQFIYISWCVSTYVNFFSPKSCVLHVCLRDLLTAKTLGSLRPKLKCVCNLQEGPGVRGKELEAKASSRGEGER